MWCYCDISYFDRCNVVGELPDGPTCYSSTPRSETDGGTSNTTTATTTDAVGGPVGGHFKAEALARQKYDL